MTRLVPRAVLRRPSSRRSVCAALLAAALAVAAVLGARAADPEFAPGQLWSIKAPASSPIKVVVGLVEPWHDTEVVHVTLLDVPIPAGFPDAGGRMAVDHVPFTRAALAASVDRLLASDADPPDDFAIGYGLWRTDHGGVYTTGVAQTVEIIFESLRRGRPGKPAAPERRTERR